MLAEPIHRWYMSVMGFAPSLVRQAFADIQCKPPGWLLDPFCGSGTTLVEGSLRGIDTIGVDANPFSAFASRTKADWNVNPDEIEPALKQIFAHAEREEPKLLDDSPIPHVIKKNWISPQVWAEARGVYHLAAQLPDPTLRRLLQLAVIAAVKESCANIAFGPEIYRRTRTQTIPVQQAILTKARQMVEDLRQVKAPVQRSHIETFHGDARELQFLAEKGFAGRVRWVITSPPYPTEHDYSRITRLELELGEFISADTDLRSIKKMQIRSNSKTVYADDRDWEYVKTVASVNAIVSTLEELSRLKSYNFAHRYPHVVANYFGGLARHLQSVTELVVPGGLCIYMLGEQRSFLGVLVPTPDIFIEIACDLLQSFVLERRFVTRIRRATRGTTGSIQEEAVVLRRR